MNFTPRPARTGRIAYRKASDDSLWGFEDWRITLEADGSRTLNAHCEMRLGEDDVLRDCTLAIDADYQPREAYVRVCNHGLRTGSAIYWMGEDTLAAECLTDGEGRLSIDAPIARPLRGFGVHAVQGDAWMAAACPFEEGPGARWVDGRHPAHSLHDLGATGPRVEFWTAGIAYHGDEEITVPAGTFTCRRLELVGMVTDHPPYYFWISTDGDCLFIKGTVAGHMDGYFQLESLEGDQLACR